MAAAAITEPFLAAQADAVSEIREKRKMANGLGALQLKGESLISSDNVLPQKRVISEGARQLIAGMCSVSYFRYYL